MIYTLLFAGGLAFFMAVEAWRGARPKASVPLWLAPLVLAALFALLVGGTILIAPYIAHALGQLLSPSDPQADQFIAIVATVIGVWSVSIILQLARNAVRLMQGRDTQDLRWIDNPFRRED